MRRYTLTDPGALGRRFGLIEPDDQLPTRARYNVAPGQGVPVVVETSRGRALRPMRWGYQPPWVLDDPGRPPPTVARVEGVAKNPLFSRALLRQRCVVPADGFYLWRGGVPIHVRLASGGLFAVAGLFTGPHERFDEFANCLVITTPPHPEARRIGFPTGRMPAILPPEAEEAWLSARTRDARVLVSMLRAYPPGLLEWAPASPLVGSLFAEGPELLEPPVHHDEPGAQRAG